MARKRSRPYGSDVTPVNSLDVLFGEERPAAELVRTEDIKTRTQPRRYFAPEKLEQLVQSVKQHGILEPLLVRPLPDNQYELVAGERRYRAAVELGLTEVPIVVRELNDTEALQLALVENLQREDLNPVEETEGILQLLALKLNLTLPEIPPLLYQMKNAFEKDKGKDSEVRDNVIPNPESDSEQGVQGVFDELGLMSWYSFTCNRLPLLRLPEDILEALRRGEIEYTKAKALAQVKDEAERKALLEEAIAQSLSLSQIRERVKTSQPPPEQGEFAARIDATTKRVKKSKVWDNPSKRQKLESLLAQLEELISDEGEDKDESLPIKEAITAQNKPQPSTNNSQDSLLIESSSDTLESYTDRSLAIPNESSLPPEEAAEKPFDQETSSSESSDESRPDAKEEPTFEGSEFTESLTHAEMVERLGVKSSTLSDAKKKPNFSSWSKSKDPDAIAWQWVAESKCFVPLKN
ncbi:ParB/RepB/Spo0J family partition protein [Allocoleopsis sp.]|uniref:ParB/RepB/Spo0J family partition protein n=1 Tax=Allocoleopsis sp. TaxID=3088169 RepID=UPI002FD41FD1